MLVEKDLGLELRELISSSYDVFDAGRLGEKWKTTAFVELLCQERLVRWLEAEGHDAKMIHAVLAVTGMNHWEALLKRLSAVHAFTALPEAQALAAANKRVGNILKKSDETVAPRTDAALFAEPAERALADALEAVAPRSAQAFEAGDYAASLQALAALKAPVDAFFDSVMVNAEDARLRANRLGLLARLHEAMNRVADLSKLAAA